MNTIWKCFFIMLFLDPSYYSSLVLGVIVEFSQSIQRMTPSPPLFIYEVYLTVRTKCSCHKCLASSPAPMGKTCSYLNSSTLSNCDTTCLQKVCSLNSSLRSLNFEGVPPALLDDKLILWGFRKAYRFFTMTSKTSPSSKLRPMA